MRPRLLIKTGRSSRAQHQGAVAGYFVALQHGLWELLQAKTDKGENC